MPDIQDPVITQETVRVPHHGHGHGEVEVEAQQGVGQQQFGPRLKLLKLQIQME